MLKNFRRVDVLQKYFNTKILQHSACNSVAIEQGEETYGESNCHGRFFRSIRGYHVYDEVWEVAVGESLVCEREPENASD